MNERKLFNTKNIALMGMLGALGGVLMLFEIPLPFIAPPFYGLDFSELPVLVGAFAMGPVAGVIIEFLKVLIKMLFKPTSTGFVGEFSNFVLGCCLVLPAAVIYRFRRTKKGAIVGLVVGTITFVVIGIIVNALVMLPFYSTLMPMENILRAGAAIHPAIGDVWTFSVMCAGPFNLVKGTAVSLVTILVYKHVSKLIHEIGSKN